MGGSLRGKNLVVGGGGGGGGTEKRNLIDSLRIWDQ